MLNDAMLHVAMHNVLMLKIVLLNVTMQNVVMLSVVAPLKLLSLVELQIGERLLDLWAGIHRTSYENLKIILKVGVPWLTYNVKRTLVTRHPYKKFYCDNFENSFVDKNPGMYPLKIFGHIF